MFLLLTWLVGLALFRECIPVCILADCFLVAVPWAVCNYCASVWVANLRNDFGELSTHKQRSYFHPFAPQPLSVSLISQCDSIFVTYLTAGIKRLHLKKTRQRITAAKFAESLCVWLWIPSSFSHWLLLSLLSSFLQAKGEKASLLQLL